MDDISIAIMAGGKSRRMGQDKASLPWNGASLLERLATAALATGSPVVIIGRPKPDDWPLENVSFAPDAYPDIGPLGGVLTALEATGDPILAVACDMPYLETRTLAWLLDAARALPPGSPGAAARNGEQIEPLFAVYGQSLRSVAAERIAAGRLSLNGLIADAGLLILDIPPDVQKDLVNVNTPEEWRNLERKINS